MTELFETIDALRGRLSGAGDVAFVATMGALHEGHLALVARARELADTVVVSIFVNPLQFGEGEDFDRYPRDVDADRAALPDDVIVFAPSAEEMYPEGPVSTRVVAGAVGDLFEGASRPGHFDGMLTVVAKLFHIVQPTVAVFGQKDAQQVFLVKRMVRDLNLPLTIDVVETVREDGGLALSSRNRYLNAEEREAAMALSTSLAAAASARDRRGALAAASRVLEGEPGVEIDYLEVVDPDTFLPVGDSFTGDVIAIIAARVGSTRLIDNRHLKLEA